MLRENMPNRYRDGYAYNPPRRGRLAARHTLLTEVYMGLTMVGLGYSGLFGGGSDGLLHRILEAADLDNTWGVGFGLIGIFMLQFSLVEFWYGREWGDVTIERFARGRKVCAFLAVALWLIVGYLLATTQLSIFKTLFFQVPINIAFGSYFFFETSRVRHYTGKWNAEARGT